MKLTHCLVFTLAIFIANVSSAQSEVATAPKVYIFGVLNQINFADTKAKWEPILEYLSQQTKLKFELKQGETVQETDKLMAEGKFDFIYTNHHLAPEYEKLGFLTLVKTDEPDIQGELIVLESSPARRIADLKDKKIAFPSESAFVAYFVPKIHLFQHKIPHSEIFAGDHEKAIQALINKEVDAAGLNSKFVKLFEQKKKVKFRHLYTSEKFPSMPVIAHPRVPQPTLDMIKKALIGIGRDAKFRSILMKAKVSGFVDATDKDYESSKVIYRSIDKSL